MNKQILPTGRMHPDEVTPTITIRLPVSLTPAAFVAYMKELLPCMVVVEAPENLSEGQFLNFQLDLLRQSQPVERLTDEQICELEYERMKTFANSLTPHCFSSEALDAAAKANVYDLFVEERDYGI